MTTIYMATTLALLQSTDPEALKEIAGEIKQTSTGVTYVVVQDKDEVEKLILERK
jgi:hypothetical protein